ncbi:MAG: type II secretion system protein, partial [Alphaproteobacteria bacterium]|nr:type II secretion system protein [Alphaproteobacteria bacterium]
QKEKILRPECGAEAPQVSNDVYNQRYTSEKVASRSKQSGRSMIEMLGVLAIIGVLTVGSITGYSKAMRRHLLNKQREQYSYILSAIETHHDAFFSLPNMGLKDTFSTFGWIPQKMMNKNDKDYIYDVFENKINISLFGTSTRVLDIQTFFSKDNFFLEQCFNLYQTFQPFHSTISVIELLNYDEEGTSTGGIYAMGDKWCTSKNHICIKNLDLNKISSLCRKACNEHRCVLHVEWRW